MTAFYDEVQTLRARYPEGTRSAILPALRLAQERHGWLSRQALEEVADALDLTPGYCYGVASFYDMFHLEPVGRHTIEVCTNVCCGLVNAQAVLEAFEQELGVGPGGTTEDGEITLRAVECLGGCSTPTIVAVDHRYRQSVTPLDVPAIVAEVEVAETRVEVVDGPALVLAGYEGEPLLSLEAYREAAGYKQLEHARAQDPQAVIQDLIASNLRGRGGAFFPTGRKASFIPTPDKIAKPIYITVNADESEPGTFKDREIMLKVPHRLIEGCLVAAHAIQSRNVYIYIRGEYLAEYESLQGAVDQARDAGILAEVEIVIHRGAGAYICGEETALLESLEGKRGQPRSKPPFPAISGVYAAPTLINNVESIATIPPILAIGPEEFAKIGAPPDSTGTRLFCLSGNIALPGVYEAPHGITVRHLIYDIGGGIPGGHTLKAVMLGGSSFPVMTPDDLETPLDADSLGKKGYFIGSGVVTTIDERSCIVQFALRVAQFYTHESCGKCTPCRVGTRWLVQLLRAVEDGTAQERDLELMLDVCDRIIGKCLCVLGDSAAMPVASCVTKFRDEFRAHLEHGGCPFGADSQLAGLFAPVDQHAHTSVPQEALV